MSKTKDTKHRARIEILNYVVCFCTYQYFGQESLNLLNKEHSFHGDFYSQQNHSIGSLVKLGSAPFSKYYLGWLKDIKKNKDRYNEEYLIESIEDGELCWWNNVSISHLPLSTSDKFPQWKWTDKQFEFNDKWKRACKRRDAYITLPCLPEFNDDGSVVLRTRTRFGLLGLDESRPEKKFDNWKKVKVKDMLEFYDYASNLKK